MSIIVFPLYGCCIIVTWHIIRRRVVSQVAEDEVWDTEHQSLQYILLAKILLPNQYLVFLLSRKLPQYALLLFFQDLNRLFDKLSV